MFASRKTLRSPEIRKEKTPIIRSSVVGLGIAGVAIMGCSTEETAPIQQDQQNEQPQQDQSMPETQEQPELDSGLRPPEFHADDDIQDIMKELDRVYTDGVCARDTEFLDMYYFHPESGIEAEENVGYILEELEDYPAHWCFWTGANLYFNEMEWTSEDSFITEVEVHPLNMNGMPNGEEYINLYSVAREGDGWYILYFERVEYLSPPGGGASAPATAP